MMKPSSDRRFSGRGFYLERDFGHLVFGTDQVIVQRVLQRVMKGTPRQARVLPDTDNSSSVPAVLPGILA